MRSYPMIAALRIVVIKEGMSPFLRYPSSKDVPKKIQRIAAVGRKMQVKEAMAREVRRQPGAGCAGSGR